MILLNNTVTFSDSCQFHDGDLLVPRIEEELLTDFQNIKVVGNRLHSDQNRIRQESERYMHEWDDYDHQGADLEDHLNGANERLSGTEGSHLTTRYREVLYARGCVYE